MTPESRAIKILNDIAPYDVSQAVWGRQIGTISQALRQDRIDVLEKARALAQKEKEREEHYSGAHTTTYIAGWSACGASLMEDIHKLKEDQSNV